MVEVVVVVVVVGAMVLILLSLLLHEEVSMSPGIREEQRKKACEKRTSTIEGQGRVRAKKD